MNAFSTINSFLFGEDTYVGGGRYGPISHPQLEFVFVQSGAVEVDVDGTNRQLIEGYAALVLSQSSLQYDYRDGIETRVLWCEATLPPSYTELTSLVSVQPMMLPVSRRMLDLQRMGMDLGPGSEKEVELLGAALGRALFQEFLYQAELRERERPIHRSVLRARIFIEQSISEPCTLGSIARYANVTPQHLTRIFKRHMGQPPIKYLWSLRAKKGAQMLRRSGLSVAEIAYQCGYENANHFSRHIKEHFGVPPTELRRRRWQK
jgi:AraC-like DNA-binding protein